MKYKLTMKYTAQQVPLKNNLLIENVISPNI